MAEKERVQTVEERYACRLVDYIEKMILDCPEFGELGAVGRKLLLHRWAEDFANTEGGRP